MNKKDNNEDKQFLSKCGEAIFKITFIVIAIGLILTFVWLDVQNSSKITTNTMHIHSVNYQLNK